MLLPTFEFAIPFVILVSSFEISFMGGFYFLKTYSDIY